MTGLIYRINRLVNLIPKNYIRLYSAQPPLTLDDVLPSSNSPNKNDNTMNALKKPINSITESTNQNYNLNISSDRFLNRSGFSYNSNRRSAIELASDPLRRRLGESTHYSLIVHSTSNNTRLTLTHTPISYLPGSSPGHSGFQSAYPMAGSVIARVTAGSVGFKRGKRQDYEAATQASNSMFNKIREILRLNSINKSNSNPTIREGIPREFEIVLNGFGVGRDAFMASLLNSQATDLREMVRSIRDSTTLKIGGPRPKKRRRV